MAIIDHLVAVRGAPERSESPHARKIQAFPLHCGRKILEQSQQGKRIIKSERMDLSGAKLLNLSGAIKSERLDISGAPLIVTILSD